jgi:hypothetical protein
MKRLLKTATAAALVALTMLSAAPVQATGITIDFPTLTFPEPKPQPVETDRGCLNPATGSVCSPNQTG